MRRVAFAVGLSAVLSTLSPAQQWGEVDLASTLTHYARVERELRARDVSHHSPEQQQARSRVLDLLRDYRQREQPSSYASRSA